MINDEAFEPPFAIPRTPVTELEFDKVIALNDGADAPAEISTFPAVPAAVATSLLPSV